MSSPEAGAGGPLADLGRRLLFNHRVLEATTEGFHAADWRHRFEGGGNSPAWILGHVARTRREWLRGLGEACPETPWEAHFARGTPCRDASAYPPPATLAADFIAVGERLAARLAAVTEAEAGAPWKEAMPDGSADVAGASRFLHFHETYHLGQIGYIRRTRGRAGFA